MWRCLHGILIGVQYGDGNHLNENLRSQSMTRSSMWRPQIVSFVRQMLQNHKIFNLQLYKW